MSVIKTVKSRVCPRVEVEIFDSTLEFLETCKTREKVIDRDLEYGSFTDCASYREALQLLNNGWKDETVKLQKKLKNVENCAYEKRITTEQSVEGFVPIVPLALNRVPNAMLNARYKPIKTKTINLIYDISCSGGWDKDDIAQNGEKIIETIVRLEKSGYRVNFNISRCVCGGNKEDCVALLVNVKPANQLLDLKRLSFPVMHSAMLRVFGFDWHYKFPNTIDYGNRRSIGYEYTEDELQKFVQDVFGEGSVYITRPTVDRKNEDELQEYLLKLLEAR